MTRICANPECGRRVFKLDAPHKPRTKKGPVPDTDWYCSLGCKWADEEGAE